MLRDHVFMCLSGSELSEQIKAVTKDIHVRAETTELMLSYQRGHVSLQQYQVTQATADSEGCLDTTHREGLYYSFIFAHLVSSALCSSCSCARCIRYTRRWRRRWTQTPPMMPWHPFTSLRSCPDWSPSGKTWSISTARAGGRR